MRLGGDDSDYLRLYEFDPDDPDYLRFDYTGGFTLSVFGASTGSAGYSVEEESNVSGLTDRGYGKRMSSTPLDGALNPFCLRIAVIAFRKSATV